MEEQVKVAIKKLIALEDATEYLDKETIAERVREIRLVLLGIG